MSSTSRRSLLRAGGTTLAFNLLAKIADSQSQSNGLDALIEGDGMVRIAPGEFLMGSQQGNPDERPVHRVRITRGFEMGRREVTQAQWETVMAEAHPRPEFPLRNAQGTEVGKKPSHFAGADLPVENVSWDDVQLFLQRLNDREPKHHYRLPTEAEWEYACRAGRTGVVVADPSGAWSKESSDQQTHPVGMKPPNAWGLYDMLGNVAEWVQDWYARDYYEGTALNDPTGPRGGTYRVFRGGSWLDSSKDSRASFRGFDFPISRFYHVGFRVVRTVK